MKTQTVGKRVGSQELYETYLVVDTPDKNPSVIGQPIRNRDGRISAVFAQLIVYSLTGFQPHIRCRLLGGLDSTQSYFSPLKSPSGQAIECNVISLPSISPAISPATLKNKPLLTYLDTQHMARSYFPPVLCLGIDLMGTDVAWTGVLSVCVTRL